MATLMISSEPDARLRPKPAFSEEFNISEDEYHRFPAAFTMTEIPQPAIVAADCIENYAAYLAAIPAAERAEFDLDVAGRWSDVGAVKRFMDRALCDAFGGEHFTVVQGFDHIEVDNFYISKPTYSFTVADSSGDALDFYSSPEGFEQPISIQACVSVTRPPVAVGA